LSNWQRSQLCLGVGIDVSVPWRLTAFEDQAGTRLSESGTKGAEMISAHGNACQTSEDDELIRLNSLIDRFTAVNALLSVQL
jgi:hypothetical protein